jgi:hypothetical protein
MGRGCWDQGPDTPHRAVSGKDFYPRLQLVFRRGAPLQNAPVVDRAPHDPNLLPALTF